MVSTILSIAAGGALGALARYGVSVGAGAVLGLAFPWGTLIVNIAGSFLMGITIALMGHIWHPPEAMRIFIITGFLGAFTTFSAFSLDAVTLWERGDIAQASLYTAGSVILSIAALITGLFITRSLFT